MTDIQLYIDGKIIYTPPGFSLVFDQESPVMDLDTIITGGIAFDIRFPFGENQITMQNAHRIDVASRKIAFPAEVYSKGELRVKGVFTMQTSAQDAENQGMYRGNITNNALAQELDKPLSDLVTKAINLGSTTASIIASAKAQNAAAMSADGVSGAVMKFVPHLNPDFYGNANPDWYDEGEWYDETADYSARDHIKFQTGGNIRNPITYQAKVDITAGESPTTEPTKWIRRAYGILNAWDADAGNFETNQIEFISDTNYLNRTALVPFLQIIDVLRDLAKTIGFTISGDFVNDTAEQRALLYSNFAMDKRILQRCFAELDTQSSILADYFVHLEATGKIPTTDYDPLTLWSDANHAFVASQQGYIKFRITGMCEPTGSPASTVRLYFQVEDGINSTGTPGANTTDGFEAWAASDFAGGPLPFDIEFTHYTNLSGADFNYELWWYFFNDGTFGEGGITDITVQVTHITLEGRNDFSGAVNYADHVPALSGIEFLLALRQWKNLHISFDMLARNMQVDYANLKLNTTPTQPDPRLRIAGHELTTRERKRFVMQYTHLPDQSEFNLGEYDEIEPVNSFAELPAPPEFLPLTGKAGKAALVIAENRYYITTSNERTGVGLEWVPGPHNYPELRLNSEGQLTPINPNAGPLPMGTALDRVGNNLTLPVISAPGRSASFNTNGQRPPLLITYWIGIDTSTIAEGYPYVSPTGTTGAGATVLTKKLNLAHIYTEHWKRTLQMLVLEEIIKVHYAYHPELKKVINFSNLLLLDHTPVLPIRTSEMIGGKGSESRSSEVEMRKVKCEALSILNGEEIIIPEPEPEPPAIPLDDLSFWYEFDNASKITENGTNIQEIISSETNAWSAVPLVNDPAYSAAGGYAQFAFGSSQGMQSVGMRAAGYPINVGLITSGFMMLVVEFDAIVNNRWIGGMCYAGAGLGSASSNTYGNFRIVNSGGSKLEYAGRMTTGGTLINIVSAITPITGKKYLLQVYVPTSGGTYIEIDGVAQGNDPLGGQFYGITNVIPSAQACKVDIGGLQGTSFIYGNSGKVYEMLSYQNYNPTAYAEVEAYLADKYGITI